MTFTLRIELGNEAMEDRADVSRALQTVAIKLCTYQHGDLCLSEGDYGYIVAPKGNTVGRWEVEA